MPRLECSSSTCTSVRNGDDAAGRETAHRVAALDVLDLDHLGTPVGEKRRRGGHERVLRHLEDAHAFHDCSHRSPLDMGHSLLGGIPASRRSFLHMGHSLLGGIPASRRSFLTYGSLAARRDTRLATLVPYIWVTRCSAGYPPRDARSLHMGHSLLGGIPASRRSFLEGLVHSKTSLAQLSRGGASSGHRPNNAPPATRAAERSIHSRSPQGGSTSRALGSSSATRSEVSRV